MYTKLKLNIELFNDLVTGTGETKMNGFFIKLTIFEKDDRFEATDGVIGNYLRFGGSGFAIKSNKDKKFGGMNNDSLILPALDKMGYAYTKFFVSDIDRYNYVKTLYETIGDWANYWWGFEEDSVSKIIVNGNKWEVVCDHANTKIMEKVY